MNILDLKKNVKKTQWNLKKLKETEKNWRILAKNSKGGSLRLLKIAPKTLKKRACVRECYGAKWLLKGRVVNAGWNCLSAAKNKRRNTMYHITFHFCDCVMRWHTSETQKKRTWQTAWHDVSHLMIKGLELGYHEKILWYSNLATMEAPDNSEWMGDLMARESHRVHPITRYGH